MCLINRNQLAMKKLNKFTKGTFKVLAKHLELFNFTHEPETLHHIRIEIKKIKAILEAIHNSNKQFKVHQHFLPFRRLFRKAAALREPLVTAELASGRPDEEKKSIADLDASNKGIVELTKEITFYLKCEGKQRKTIIAAVSKIHKKTFDKYIRKLIRQIMPDLYPKLHKNRIHKIRKKIKTLLYLSETRKLLTKSKRAFLKYLEESIGQLHDKDILLASVKNKALGVDSKILTELKLQYRKDMTAVSSSIRKFYTKQ